VKLIKLDEGDEIAAISQIEEQEEPVTNIEITEVIEGAEVPSDEATPNNEDSQLDNENNQTTNQDNPPQPS
jgi:DNA gyrase subunit A